MTYALDTNIIIRLLRNEESVTRNFDNAVERKANIAISPFVDYEVWRGFIAVGASRSLAAQAFSKSKRRFWKMFAFASIK